MCIIDHLFLRRRHLLVFRLVEHEGEGGRVERHFHVIFGDFVDAEQQARTPGNVTASATPLPITSRTSGADACTLVPPSSVTNSAMVPCAGRIFMPLMSAGTITFLVDEC